MKPNFLFIGPDKTGSSWLYELLRSHPQCFVPQCKDIYFFDRHYGRGLNWYLSFFTDAPADARAVGEISHDYLFSAPAVDRIQHDLPGVKLLTSLRCPAERTFSHYLYLVRSGMTRLPFDEALAKFPELIDNSRYYHHLSRFFDKFAANQIKVLWFEDLQRDPQGYGATCLRFLGLDPLPEYDYAKKIRSASRPRSYWLAKLAKLGANSARAVRLERLVGRVKNGWLAGVLYTPYAPAERPRMSSESRQRLTAVFRDDLLALERLLDVDLSHWYREGQP